MINEIVFTFATTNYSIKAERTLRKSNIPIRIMPLPSEIKAGCGLCLRVSENFVAKAKEILVGSSIKIESIYRRTEENSKSKFTYLEGV